MPKKSKRGKKPADTSPYREPRRAIRLYVTVAEYHAIRVRAAEMHLSMAEFCRRASVEQAREGPMEAG